MNSEKDYVSVLPRIIDPGMQFTKESIRNTIDTNPTQPRRDIESDSTLYVPYKGPNKEISEFKKKDTSEKDVNNKYSFFSDYKTIIIIILIVIVIIVLSYLIYRYFNKDSKNIETNTITNTITSEIKDKENKENNENKDTSSKENAVNMYLSNYIQDDDDNQSVTSTKEQEETQQTIQENLEKMNYGDLKIPDDNINSSEVEEIVNNMANNNNYQYDNYMPVMGVGVVEMQIKNKCEETIDIDDIVMDIQSTGELTENNQRLNGRINNKIEILEDDDINSVVSEDYTSLLDDNDDKTNVVVRDAEDVYNHIFKNNDPELSDRVNGIIDGDNKEQTTYNKQTTTRKKKDLTTNDQPRTHRKITNTPKEVKNENISSSLHLDVDPSDDITYFKKFSNGN